MTDEKKVSNEDISQALADSMGLSTGGREVPESVGNFFESVKKASTDDALPAQPDAGNTVSKEAPAPAKFVHEPTGKEFGDEVEYLRYNSGWTAQNLGEKNKALELQMAELKGKVEAGQQQPQKVQSKMDLKRQLWPNASEESLNDYASDFILEGVENAVGIVVQSNQSELAKRDQLISQLSSQLDETAARANSGVDSAVEQRILQKHPGLANLPAAERMAMVKDLAGVAPAQAGPGKLLDNISAAGNPADHVEGSALSTPQSTEDALHEEFDKIDNVKDELSLLGRMVEGNREFFGYQTDRPWQ